MTSTSALKVTPVNTPAKLANGKIDAKASATAAGAPASAANQQQQQQQAKSRGLITNPADISSPHELTAFVETLLENLDAKFDEMSSQILDRMMQMSSRVDALEASIQDIINGDGPPVPSVPSSPKTIPNSTSSTPMPGPPRRTASGL